MSTTQLRPQVEQNIEVLNQAGALFGIFMGIWWGIFTEAVFSPAITVSPLFPSVPLSRLRWIYMIVSLIYTAILVYIFTRWIWAVAEIHIGLSLLDYWRLLQRIFLWSIVISAGMTVLGLIGGKTFSVNCALALSGGLLLLVWMITSFVLVHWKMFHERRKGAIEWR